MMCRHYQDNRLIIQQGLIKSAYDELLISKVEGLEDLHYQDFMDSTFFATSSGSDPFWKNLLEAAVGSALGSVRC